MLEAPDPGSVSPDEARALIREIRGTARPKLLDELRQLYQLDDGGVMARVNILAAELRLQKLDRYLERLLPVSGRDGGLTGWDAFRPSLRGVRQRDDGRLEAAVDLAYTPENHDCVHGPCTLLAVCALASRALAAGERLNAIERIAFNLPLRHRVRLTVWDTAKTALMDMKGSMSGKLRTTRGRTLAFSAQPLREHLLQEQRDHNRLSLGLMEGRPVVTDAHANTATIELSDDGLVAARVAVARNTPLYAALALDLVGIAILSWKRGRGMLASAFRDVPLPAVPARVFVPGARLELRHLPRQSHRITHDGFRFGYYEFRYVPAQTDWSAMLTAETENLDMLQRRLHAQA